MKTRYKPLAEFKSIEPSDSARWSVKSSIKSRTDQ